MVDGSSFASLTQVVRHTGGVDFVVRVGVLFVLLLGFSGFVRWLDARYPMASRTTSEVRTAALAIAFGVTYAAVLI